MDHNIAIENHTAERYLMGELTEVDRDAYEEHFFSCPACADEIRSANAFMENARKVFREEAQAKVHTNRSQRSAWSQWLNWRTLLQPIPAAAFALLLAVVGVVGYQNSVTIPRLALSAATAKGQPQLTAELVYPKPFLLEQARGGRNVITVPENMAFPLQFDIVDVGFSSYQVEVLDESGATRFSLTVPQKNTANPVQFVVRANVLQTGKYFLVVREPNSGGSSSGAKGELSRLSFELKLQD